MDHHTPGTSWAKRQAAKAVRRFRDDISNGKWYRKLYCSWDICDYRSYETKQQAIHQWETSKRPRTQHMTRDEVINAWAKQFRRK